MKKVITLLFFSSLLFAAPHLVAYRCSDDFVPTYKRVLIELLKNRLHVYKIIDHRKNALKAKIRLSPSKVILFGNAKIETILLSFDIRSGVDLPFKMFVYKKRGKTFLLYHRPIELLDSYHLPETIIHQLDNLFRQIAKKACR